jgi:hypothetical protein
MKYVIAGAFILAFASIANAQSNPNDHYVNGYTRSNGTYVEPHYQTNPNNTTRDNYGTQGNYNPHNGTYGTRSQY